MQLNELGDDNDDDDGKKTKSTNKTTDDRNFQLYLYSQQPTKPPQKDLSRGLPKYKQLLTHGRIVSHCSYSLWHLCTDTFFTSNSPYPKKLTEHKMRKTF